MTDIEITYDARWPTNAVFAEVDGDTVRVTISPDVEAGALSVLDQSIALAVADAVDGRAKL